MDLPLSRTTPKPLRQRGVRAEDMGERVNMVLFLAFGGYAIRRKRCQTKQTNKQTIKKGVRNKRCEALQKNEHNETEKKNYTK